MKKRSSVFAAATLILALTLSGAGQQSAEQIYKSGLYEEEVGGNLQKAIEIYQDLLKRYPDSREVAAKAQLHIGLCYEKLGTAEAAKAFERVIADFPEQTAEVKAARERLAAIGRSQTARGPAGAGPSVRLIWSGPDAGRAGRVSPDGKFLTLIDDLTGNLCLRELATGKTANVTNRDPSKNRFEFAGLACWSPDGATLAYGWLNGGAALDVRTIGVDGSHERILYQKPNEFALPMAWSPDGRFLAIEFVRDSYTTFGIGVLSLEDGSLRVLKESKLLKTVPKNVVFSRDGRSVLVDLPQAADDPKHDIFAFPLEGRTETRVVEHAANDAVLEWIPGSDTLLFASDRTGTLDAWMVEIAGGLPRGEPRLVRRNLGDIMSLGFSREGTYFYRLPVDMEDIAVASIDIDKRSLLEGPKTLPQEMVGVSYSPQWSPDGKALAFISTRKETLGGRTIGILRIQSVETGEIRDVPMKMTRFGRATWAPDGRSIFILGSDEKLGQALLRVDVETGEATVLVANGRTDANMTSIAPAPDGRTVYYTVFEFGKKRSRIMALDLSTRESREIHQQEAPLNLAGLSLSQDGKQLMFGTAEPDLSWVLKAIALPDGPPREIVRAKTSAISASIHGSYCWTPARDGILFFKGDPAGKKKTWELCYAPAGGGEIQSVGLVIDGAPSSLSLHPDGHRLAIAVMREGGEVWAMENFLPPGKQ